MSHRRLVVAVAIFCYATAAFAAAVEKACPSDLRRIVRKDGVAMCLCPMRPGVVCLGPMCLTGHPKQSKAVLSAYVSSCASCQCLSLTPEEYKVVRPRVWSNQFVYYHLHISKTGGTTFMRLLQKLVQQPIHGQLTMCESESPPFSHEPYFADPLDLRMSGCNVASAEGTMKDIPGQFLDQEPLILLMLRHPLLRTRSQWNHDKKYENSKRTLSRFDEFKTLKSLYTALGTATSDIPARYGNWYAERIREPNVPLMVSISSFAFVGITEHYVASVCLFFFTFQVHKRFHYCENTPQPHYNAACDPTKDGDECKGKAFTNRHTVDSNMDPHKETATQLAAIPDDEMILMKRAAFVDMQIYDHAVDIFWKRVAIMARVSGKKFADLPQKYKDWANTAGKSAMV